MNERLRRQLRESYAAWLATEKLYADFARRQGMSFNELFTLYAIARGEQPVSQHQICQDWSFPKQTVHSILQGLERRGLVLTQPQETDRRNKTLTLTAPGQALAEQVLSALDRAELAALGRMTTEERESLLRCNRLFHAYLSEAMDENRKDEHKT